MAVKMIRLPDHFVETQPRPRRRASAVLSLPTNLIEPNDTLESFWRAIAARPRDHLPKAIFADYLDESGDQRGNCLRWIVATSREPLQAEWWNSAAGGYAPIWGWCIWYSPGIRMPWAVERRLYDRLPARFRRTLAVSPAAEYDNQMYRCTGGGNPTGAVRALCRAWAKCVEVGVDPLGDCGP